MFVHTRTPGKYKEGQRALTQTTSECDLTERRRGRVVGEAKSLRRLAVGAHSLLCHSLLMQPSLSDYSREGRRRNREGGREGGSSQPASPGKKTRRGR